YLNKPELTADKFVSVQNSWLSTDKKTTLSLPSTPLYKTGDLSRWLPDGNIEFLGRMDYQVKIRGYRIELGEIESKLLEHEEIKEAVVLVHKSHAGDKYLCAYIVPTAPTEPGSITAPADRELKQYLSSSLPDYMIPGYYVCLDNLPLTPNGKLERRALPQPRFDISHEHIAPRDHIEERMASIWSGVLELEKEKIGIHDNFFHLGGHSLKAVVMVSKLHQAFNVNVPLVEIFKTPDINGLALYIKGAERETFVSVEPAEKKEYYQLSSQQQRMYILQQMEPQGIGYNMPEIISIGQEAHLQKLEETFDKIIKRHESLRTSFHLIDEHPVQQIHSDVDFKIKQYEITEADGPDRESIASVMKNLVRPFDLSQAPLLRCELIKTTTRFKLIIDMHHIISDGVSHTVLKEDFVALYKGETLLPLRIHYKDFSQWQNRARGKHDLERQEAHWQQRFAGEIPQLSLPLDYPRPQVQRYEGIAKQFEIQPGENQRLRALARDVNSTLFMLLLALFNILLAKLGGQEDVVVGTPVAGRRHVDLEKIIGMFVNTLALRNYPRGESTFRQYHREVTQNTLSDFENQGYQFEELVDNLTITRDAARNPLFDVMLTMQNNPGTMANNSTEATPGRLPGQGVGRQEKTPHFREAASKFDMTLNVNDTGENLYFVLTCNKALFKKETIDRFIGYYKRILATATGNIETKVSQISIIGSEEKKRVLYEFNDTNTQYPGEKTIHGMFEEQTARTPGKIAVTGPSNTTGNKRGQGNKAGQAGYAQLTYSQLNEKAQHLADRLRTGGLEPGTVAAIMMEPSIGMITAIVAVLKTGACYLPIDPLNPPERTAFLLSDSETRQLLTGPQNMEKITFDGEIINVSEHNVENTGETPGKSASGTGGITGKNNTNGTTVAPHHRAAPSDPVYMIYTSGTTGEPKGVVLTHGNLVNYHDSFSQKAALYVD
ncbi:MAG: AMP-binding protein, partial [bacterium]|nr:AMP-binding protein [bacterium]